ncbi:hypothetical protein HY404_02875 [Candidatus Microgenomates bacterium]|nr:hypothetical protein [Candidatus Microgenomates bacterium]
MNSEYILKSRLVTPIILAKDFILILIVIVLIYYAAPQILNRDRLWLILIAPILYLLTISMRISSKIVLSDSQLDFSKEVATVFVWPGLGSTYKEVLDIKDIVQIKKNFKVVTMRGWYMWWTLDLVLKDGKHKSINYYWYKKQELGKLLSLIITNNPRIKVDSFTQNLISTFKFTQ